MLSTPMFYYECQAGRPRAKSSHFMFYCGLHYDGFVLSVGQSKQEIYSKCFLSFIRVAFVMQQS